MVVTTCRLLIKQLNLYIYYHCIIRSLIQAINSLKNSSLTLYSFSHSLFQVVLDTFQQGVRMYKILNEKQIMKWTKKINYKLQPLTATHEGRMEPKE